MFLRYFSFMIPIVKVASIRLKTFVQTLLGKGGCSLCWRDSRMESLITTIKVKYVAWKRTAASASGFSKKETR